MTTVDEILYIDCSDESFQEELKEQVDKHLSERTMFDMIERKVNNLKETISVHYIADGRKDICTFRG
jgi:hypothetical protein